MNQIRLRYLLRERDTRGCEGEAVLSVYRDLGVIPKKDRKDNFNKTPEDLSNYKLALPGDVVMNKMKAWQGSVAVSSFRGIVSGDYMVCEVITDVDRSYLHHLLRSDILIKEYGARAKGIRPQQWRLYWEDFADIGVPMPPYQEQVRIGRLLDAETARIDELIARKRYMIELLREHQQGFIDNQLEACDEWLPLKYAIRYREGPGIMAADFQDEGVPLIRVQGLVNGRVTLAGCGYLNPEMVARKWSQFRYA